jgi:lipopolysaccharide biosynthesis glycosyltransferase
MPLAVMLYSACMNLSEGYALDIYVISEDLEDSDKRRVERTLEKYDSSTCVHWVSPTGKNLNALPATGHITTASYLRLFAPHVVPNKYDKAFYLDADLLVEGDLSVLFDRSVSQSTVLAVPSYSPETIGDSPLDEKALSLDPQRKYFNAGVLLINTENWVSNQVTDKVVEFCKRNRSMISFEDQDGLNAVLFDEWECLDPAWNVTLPSAPEYFGISDAKLKRRIENREMRILHFTTKFKPWNTLGRAPGHHRFYHYLYRSGWFSPPGYAAWRVRTAAKAIADGISKRIA